MNIRYAVARSWLRQVMITMSFLFSYTAYAQQGLIINLAPIDGIDITPDNIFNFQVQSGVSGALSATVNGTIRYRNSNLSLSYSFKCTLHLPGLRL